jgi:hypothetical protein
MTEGPPPDGMDPKSNGPTFWWTGLLNWIRRLLRRLTGR